MKQSIRTQPILQSYDKREKKKLRSEDNKLTVQINQIQLPNREKGKKDRERERKRSGMTSQNT